MIAKYLICLGICLITLFFSLYLIIVSSDRLDESEYRRKYARECFYTVLLIFGFLFSIASAIGTVVLIILTMAKFLHG